MSLPPNSRPYWHVDAKWICGLLLFAALGATLTLYNLSLLTTEPVAVRVLSVLLASAFSPDGLDAEIDMQALRQQVPTSPDGSLQPIPGLRIAVQTSDFENLPPRQARLLFFSQVAGPLYREGAAGLAALADDPEMRRSILQGTGPLGLLSAATHARLQAPLMVSAGVSAVLLALLVLFSYRSGRLFSPGCVLLAASLPMAFLLGLLTTALQHPPEPGGGDDPTAAIIAGNVLPEILPLLLRHYTLLVALGLALVALALVGGLIFRRRRA